ncbi:PREDICTED: uncharacterized protein LOC105453118 [Wasmannia auropunctata]|uniref:uncharacterized protein LOC105453118 n=1 Tax=Wasmannia auropunctata TaxID=64793 RepID=UPI0005ED5B9B|nr:PREDICTED: uncharacterized protein LOC105453118 [Wasmannia auropunctata]
MSDYRLSFLVGCLNWLVFLAGSTVVHANATETDVTPRILSRSKRYLIFPQGSNFQPSRLVKVYASKLNLIGSAGLDGRSCVMRALCEAGQREPAHVGAGTFVQELLHAIFTLPRDGARFERTEDRAYDRAYETGGDCERLYPTCRHSIYDVDF